METQCSSKHWKTGEPCVLSEGHREFHRLSLDEPAIFESIYDLEQSLIESVVRHLPLYRSSLYGAEGQEILDALDALMKARET